MGDEVFENEMGDRGKKADLHELHPTPEPWIIGQTDTDDSIPRKSARQDTRCKPASRKLEAPKSF